MSYESELKVAIEAAERAGEYLLRQKEGKIESSAGKDIKLVNDRQSEALIIDVLSPTGIPILSEERGLSDGDDPRNGLMWIVDPLDGSANYIKGMKELTCVSVALWENDRPVLGVVFRYERNELFAGLVDKGAYLNDIPIKPSDVSEIGSAVLATGFPLKRSYSGNDLGKFIRSVQQFKKIRMLGAAALMGVYVGCGRVDAYTEDDIMIWDIGAATAIVLAAGGYVSVEKKNDNKCTCELFANEKLYSDYRKQREF